LASVNRKLEITSSSFVLDLLARLLAARPAGQQQAGANAATELTFQPEHSAEAGHEFHPAPSSEPSPSIAVLRNPHAWPRRRHAPVVVARHGFSRFFRDHFETANAGVAGFPAAAATKVTRYCRLQNAKDSSADDFPFCRMRLTGVS